MKLIQIDNLHKEWRPGDNVKTKYSGSETSHTITEIWYSKGCESGLLVRVTPAVPKSGGIESWLDANWFYSD